MHFGTSLILAALLAPTAVLAQESGWEERRTDRFAILYAAGDEQAAAHYASFVDAIYDEVAATFAHRTATPITLRLYPSIERYPAEHLRRYEVLARVSNIPHPRVRLVPILAEPTQETSQALPHLVIQERAVFVV